MGEDALLVILLESDGRDAPRRVVAIFGVGLLGSAIEKSLRSRYELRRSHLQLHWFDREQQEKDLGIIERAVSGKLERDTTLGIVWSAGRAGFSSTAEEADDELRSFRSVVALSERLSGRVSQGRANFVLLSSAGGLFEGQREVNRGSNPRPLRPYGAAKWEQEKILETAAPEMRKSILRISSAYGHIRSGHRSGLIPTMVANCIRRRVTMITGTMNTLRDFVWVDDVADFVACRVLDKGPRPRLATEILASGRPHSIFEIKKIVEDRLRSPLFISYVPGGLNREDITFSRSALPAEWHPSDLRTNVHRVTQAALPMPIR